MKIPKIILPLIAIGALASASSSQAAYVTGYVWENSLSSWETLASPTGSVPTAAPLTTLASGTLSGNGPIDFFALNNNPPIYTIAGFLASGGYNYAETGLGAGSSSRTLNNTLFQFTGFTLLTTGQQIQMWNDDGAILKINGVTVISNPQPQSDHGAPYTYVWGGATGVYTFDLLYAEVYGAPAELQSNLAIAVPEPSTVVAGALLLLPFGVSTLRILRKKQVS